LTSQAILLLQKMTSALESNKFERQRVRRFVKISLRMQSITQSLSNGGDNVKTFFVKARDQTRYDVTYNVAAFRFRVS